MYITYKLGQKFLKTILYMLYFKWQFCPLNLHMSCCFESSQQPEEVGDFLSVLQMRGQVPRGKVSEPVKGRANPWIQVCVIFVFFLRHPSCLGENWQMYCWSRLWCWIQIEKEMKRKLHYKSWHKSLSLLKAFTMSRLLGSLSCCHTVRPRVLIVGWFPKLRVPVPVGFMWRHLL